MIFDGNSASKVGDAIFAKDIEYLVQSGIGGNEPFFVIYENVTLTWNFTGNTAELAGCVIYGGWIDSGAVKKPNITIITKDT